VNNHITDELRQTISKVVEELREERDELNLKMDHAATEIRDEWEELEKKWQHFLTRAHRVEDAAKESSHEIGAAVALLGEELKASFKRVRKML
jgi:cytochrome c556